MKKFLMLILTVLLTVLVGCSSAKQEAVKKTYNAILAENYTEAEKWAETAVIEGYDRDKFLKLKNNIEIYNDAEEALDSLDYKLAQQKLKDRELLKGDKMSSALFDLSSKIIKIESIVTGYEENEPASYSVAIDNIDKLFADFKLSEKQKTKLIEYKESAQQNCIKRAIETHEYSIAANYADDFLADSTLSEKQIEILKGLKFDAQVLEIEKNINDKFLDDAAKKKLEELLNSQDLTDAQRKRLLQISPANNPPAVAEDIPAEQRSPKAYIDEEAAVEAAKQAYPDEFKSNSEVTVIFDNGVYIVNVVTQIKSSDDVIQDEVAIFVDALTGIITNIVG